MYTPTDEEVREAIAEWAWSRRMFRPELGQSDGGEGARWLAAHGAALRAEWEAEQGEVEWGIETEYGCGQVGVRYWGNPREDIEAKLPDYPGGRLVRRRKAGPWRLVEQGDES